MPKTPEQWLAVSTPPEKTKGTLKLFLGYAPGVGKTFGMLSEAIRRHLIAHYQEVIAAALHAVGREHTHIRFLVAGFGDEDDEE